MATPAAPRAQLIYTDVPGSLPADYVIPPNLDLDLSSVFAKVNGASASASFLPCLTLLSQDGKVIARVKQDDTYAVGDTGDATWSPFLRTSAAAVRGPGTYQLLFDQTLSAPATSMDTTGTAIGGGIILEVWVVARVVGAFNAVTYHVNYNNDTTGIYDFAWVRNVGGAVGTQDGQSQTFYGAQCPGTSLPAGVFSTTRLTIPNYTNTSLAKTAEFTCGFADDNNVVFDRAIVGTAVWRSTSEITSVQISSPASDFDTGTRLLVYSR